jgi:hypothetical protein
MNRRLALTVAVFTLLGARRAAAQDVTVGYQGLPYKVVGESRTGINVSEGVILHVGAGVEAGYDDNVFYSNSQSPGGVVGSGIIRVNSFAEISNASRVGGSPSAIVYDVRAGLLYRDYTSSNPAVQSYSNAFMPSAGLSLSTTTGTTSFQLVDAFLRTEDPPYAGVATDNPTPITRNNNLATIQASWAPGGGRISGTLRYTNQIDIFDESSGFSYANSVSHQLMLDVSWKWLPKTAIFLQATQGYVSYLSQDPMGKVPSYPFHVYAGLRGLITPKISALVALGYANAFYSSGTTTGGFLGSTYIDAQGTYVPTLLSRVVLGYHQDFQNSVISNFYYSYSVYLSYVQQLMGRLSLDLSGRYSYLSYQGLLGAQNAGMSRTDNTVTAGATLDYFFRSWIYGGVGYSLTVDSSDYKIPGTGLPVSYTKQQVFARLGVTY